MGVADFGQSVSQNVVVQPFLMIENFRSPPQLKLFGQEIFVTWPFPLEVNAKTVSWKYSGSLSADSSGKNSQSPGLAQETFEGGFRSRQDP